jgi:hypothetical protein
VSGSGDGPTRALTIQLLEWLLRQPRTYDEVIDAWRTTCPRLSIWEDACIDGLVDSGQGRDRIVTPSAKGRALLQASERDPTRDGGPDPSR